MQLVCKNTCSEECPLGISTEVGLERWDKTLDRGHVVLLPGGKKKYEN